MFGFFKKEPVEIKFDYDFSSRVASSFEGFLVACAKDWDNPSEKLKNYSMHVSPTGGLSIQLNRHEKVSEDSIYVVPFDLISNITSINSVVIDMIGSGPFVNPLVSEVSNEIVRFMIEEKES